MANYGKILHPAYGAYTYGCMLSLYFEKWMSKLIYQKHKSFKALKSSKKLKLLNPGKKKTLKPN